MKNSKTAYLVIFILLVAAFGVGAIWSNKKLFPYEQIKQMDLLVMLKRQVAGSVTANPIVESAYTNLELEHFAVGSEVNFRVEKGGITTVGDDVLIVSARGDLLLYQKNAGETVIRKLDIETNNNFDQARAHAKTISDSQETRIESYFNYLDVLFHKDSESQQILLSHLFWNTERRCLTIRLSRLRFGIEDHIGEIEAGLDDWEVMFETSPCVPLEESPSLDLTGGRLFMDDLDSILMSVGSIDLRNSDREAAFPQDPDADYGKVIRINTQDFGVSHISTGQRNTQGLTIDRQGRIWTTEHGPQGGDELNQVFQGANFGYPYVTHGTSYGKSTWPRNTRNGFHEGYELPIFAWVPSIGVSNLIQVDGFLPEWDGDLLVSTLKARTLFRMRIRDGRVVIAEPIRLGVRIRDIDQSEDGKTIILWSDDHVLSFMSPKRANMVDVSSLMRNLGPEQKIAVQTAIEGCQKCHASEQFGSNQSAPNLWGVMGRQIAGTNYASHSSSLQERSGAWTDAELDLFLEDPQNYASDTTMVGQGIADPFVRQKVVEYLGLLK